MALFYRYDPLVEAVGRSSFVACYAESEGQHNESLGYPIYCVRTCVRAQGICAVRGEDMRVATVSLLRHGLTSLEVCAGGGGQALGLERAGFQHLALVENDSQSCSTLRRNRREWNVLEADLRSVDLSAFKGVDLLAGGLPCPPFSVAGHQLGEGDDRNLFGVAVSLIDLIRPRSIMFENVRGLLSPRFDLFRDRFSSAVEALGYRCEFRLLHASDFGVPQLRPRLVFVALRKPLWTRFSWPVRLFQQSPSVGETLLDLMQEGGWSGAEAWAARANRIAPTIVGGSKRHGGPDLGPTRARKAWAEMHVDGRGIANFAPEPSFTGMPRLTLRMVARLQGFTDDWEFVGGKTAAYRQIGNAFPPPVAHAVAYSLAIALSVKGQAAHSSIVA